MTYISRTEAVKAFLTHMTHPDLANLYKPEMEMQLNVAQDGGTRVEGDFKGRQWHGWTDGLQTWKSFRIPWKANSEPEYKDSPMNFDIAAHAEGIGMTGWDWVNRVSRWVAFDFDAISGHSDKHQRKLTDEQLQEVLDRLHKLEWATIRRSTGGKGLHVYVFLDGTPTANHTEHGALARCILGQLSAAAKFDFQAKVDSCGNNMWVWHRKMKGTNGLQLIKAGSTYTDIPPTWRDHVQVVSGARRKILPQFIETGGKADDFQALTAQRTRVDLDNEHSKLIDWLREQKCTAWWDKDHHMLVTHTFHLKEAHKALNLKGPYDTLSLGKEAPGDHNCYLFPMRHGSWSVRRFSQGVAEHVTWTQDGAGWTRCFLNREPDLASAARLHKGVENDKGGYVFNRAMDAVDTIKTLGGTASVPEWARDHKAYIKEHKDGRLILEMDEGQNDTNRAIQDGSMVDWLLDKKKWKKILDIRNSTSNEPEVVQYDDLLRHITTSENEDAGWVVQSEGIWRSEPMSHVRPALKTMGFSAKESDAVVGSAILKCWTLVNKPFEDEYPMNREWNRGAAQYQHVPNPDKENLSFPTWLKVLNHCGKSLDFAIKNMQWAKDNGIMTGGDYLKCWIASSFQFPTEPLPYLFFFGEQGTGKSIFHEALSLLLTRGVVRAENSLTSNFNGELAGAVFAIIEEIDLNKNRSAYNKIKDWTTARYIPIRELYRQTYSLLNSLHFIQCSNNHPDCPVFPGDTRVVVSEVFPLDNPIPKKEFMKLLEKEAPDFLAEVLSLELPPPIDRLNIPVVMTDSKHLAMSSNRSMLEQFLDEKVQYVPGHVIKYSEFYERFVKWLDTTDVPSWPKNKVGRSLSSKYPKGRSTQFGAAFYIGNMTWVESENPVPGKRLVLRGDFLCEIES